MAAVGIYGHHDDTSFVSKKLNTCRLSWSDTKCSVCHRVCVFYDVESAALFSSTYIVTYLVMKHFLKANHALYDVVLPWREDGVSKYTSFIKLFLQMMHDELLN